jgi:hypothetical protein
MMSSFAFVALKLSGRAQPYAQRRFIVIDRFVELLPHGAGEEQVLESGRRLALQCGVHGGFSFRGTGSDVALHLTRRGVAVAFDDAGDIGVPGVEIAVEQGDGAVGSAGGFHGLFLSFCFCTIKYNISRKERWVNDFLYRLVKFIIISFQ